MYKNIYEDRDFDELIKWYKKNKPELCEEKYCSLNVGDIVKTSGGEYWVIYPSESYLVDANLIPARIIVNDKNSISRIEGGKAGFQIFECKEKIKVCGKTDFFCMEALCWEGDKTN